MKMLVVLIHQFGRKEEEKEGRDGHQNLNVYDYILVFCVTDFIILMC